MCARVCVCVCVCVLVWVRVREKRFNWLRSTHHCFSLPDLPPTQIILPPRPPGAPTRPNQSVPARTPSLARLAREPRFHVCPRNLQGLGPLGPASGRGHGGSVMRCVCTDQAENHTLCFHSCCVLVLVTPFLLKPGSLAHMHQGHSAQNRYVSCPTWVCSHLCACLCIMPCTTMILGGSQLCAGAWCRLLKLYVVRWCTRSESRVSVTTEVHGLRPLDDATPVGLHANAQRTQRVPGGFASHPAPGPL